MSRFVARIFASRIRNWAEELDIVDENQNGFRQNISSCDATQMILRIDEEVRRVWGKCDDRSGNKPGAILLDITKAYPRVNRPLLWPILENLGMREGTIWILKGLHEYTKYRVKGKERMSEDWQPERSLREGCATSPVLFNIFHAESIRKAAEEKRNAAIDANQEYGLNGPGSQEITCQL